MTQQIPLGWLRSAAVAYMYLVTCGSDRALSCDLYKTMCSIKETPRTHESQKHIDISHSGFVCTSLSMSGHGDHLEALV